jgi:hypothetical protein
LMQSRQQLCGRAIRKVTCTIVGIHLHRTASAHGGDPVPSSLQIPGEGEVRLEWKSSEARAARQALAQRVSGLYGSGDGAGSVGDEQLAVRPPRHSRKRCTFKARQCVESPSFHSEKHPCIVTPQTTTTPPSTIYCALPRRMCTPSYRPGDADLRDRVQVSKFVEDVTWLELTRVAASEKLELGNLPFPASSLVSLRLDPSKYRYTYTHASIDPCIHALHTLVHACMRARIHA